MYNILSSYINILLSLYIFRNRRKKSFKCEAKLPIVLLPEGAIFYAPFIPENCIFLCEKCTIIVLFPVLCIVFYKLVHILRRTCHIKWYTAAEKTIHLEKLNSHSTKSIVCGCTYVCTCLDQNQFTTMYACISSGESECAGLIVQHFLHYFFHVF